MEFEKGCDIFFDPATRFFAPMGPLEDPRGSAKADYYLIMLSEQPFSVEH